MTSDKAFVLDRGMAGFAQGKPFKKMGLMSRPAGGRPTWTSSRSGGDQLRSYRSSIMTLSHAATKSRANFSFASSLA
jgi:hypothetical protein